MQTDQEELILKDISFDLFLGQFKEQRIHALLKISLKITGSLSDTEYGDIVGDIKETVENDFGLTTEQSTVFLQKCGEYRERYLAHKTIFDIINNIGADEFLQKITNITTRKTLFNLLAVCGEINDGVFNECMEDNDLAQLELVGDQITTFRGMCSSFREQYKKQNILTSLSRQRDGFQYTFRDNIASAESI